jgi:hypothetical protein
MVHRHPGLHLLTLSPYVVWKSQMSLSSLYGPGVFRWLRPWRLVKQRSRRRSWGENSWRRLPEAALTAATVLPALLLYSKVAYYAIFVQSLTSLAIRWSLMSEGRRRRNKAMK